MSKVNLYFSQFPAQSLENFGERPNICPQSVKTNAGGSSKSYDAASASGFTTQVLE